MLHNCAVCRGCGSLQQAPTLPLTTVQTGLVGPLGLDRVIFLGGTQLLRIRQRLLWGKRVHRSSLRADVGGIRLSLKSTKSRGLGELLPRRRPDAGRLPV